MIARVDAEGIEYDWLAVDSEGFVALFSTAGAGVVPDELLRRPEAFDEAIDSILDLPVRSVAECDLILPPDRVNTWRLVAERGLYAFDSDPAGGPYRLIAKPRTPARLDDLPPALASVVGRIVLPRVSFRFALEVMEDKIPH